MSRITGPLSYEGVRSKNPPEVIIATGAPGANAKDYNVGDIWWDRTTSFFYLFAGVVATVPNWIFIGGSSSTVLSVANGGTGASTLTDHGVLVGSGTDPITALAVGATGTILVGVTGADPVFSGTPTISGTLTLSGAGAKFNRTSVATTTAAGANSTGTVTLVGGTATISTTSVTASSQIRLWRQGIGATGAAALGILTVGTIVAGTSFVIRAVQTVDATALQATDVSIIAWDLVN